MEILHSKIVGAGKPILILHGYLGMGDNWKTHANKLAKDGFEVHLIDQRNHGRSFHAVDFSYAVMVEDLNRYIAFHQLGKVDLLGHSMGGKTAMLFAVTYPEKVDKLIVADISPKAYPAHHNAILRALNSVDFSLQNTRKLVDSKLAELIPEVGIRGFLAKNLYWEKEGQLAFRFNLKVLTEKYEEVITELPSDKVFTGDVLFLSGEKSAYIAEEDTALIKSHFPNSQLKKIANAGHWLHAENPSDFYSEIISFLGDA